MDRYRRDAGWKAFSALLVLGLGIIAFVIWAALSAVHAAENDRCKPFNEGYNTILGMAAAGHGALYKIPEDKMGDFVARLKDTWDGLDGESAFFLDLPMAIGIFVKHGDQLCEAMPKPDATEGTDL